MVMDKGVQIILAYNKRNAGKTVEHIEKTVRELVDNLDLIFEKTQETDHIFISKNLFRGIFLGILLGAFVAANNKLDFKRGIVAARFLDELYMHESTYFELVQRGFTKGKGWRKSYF